MEHFAPPRPSEADKDDDKDAESFLSPLSEEAKLGFYEQVQALFQNPEQEDDEEDETDPKKKRKRRLLDFFRRKKIARSTLEEETEPNPHAMKRLPSLLNLEIDQPNSTEGEIAATDNQTENFNFTLPGLEEVPVLPGDDSSKPETVPQPAINEISPEEASLDAEESSLQDLPNLMPVVPLRGGDALPPSPPDNPGDIPPLPELPDDGGEATAVSAPDVADHTTINNITNLETHPNNAGPAIVGSVIVDQLSRHRDRKIRKEARTLKKQVEKQEKAHIQAETALEKKQKQLHNMIEQQAASPPPEKVVTVERHHATTSEQSRSETATRQKSVETTNSVTEKKQMESQLTRDSLSPEVSDANARLVLEQVEAAAERDVAVEGQFERRHEAKDEPTTASGAHYDFGAAAPTSSSPTAVTEYKQALTTKLNLKQPGNPDRTGPNHSPVQLKQAALMGVATALFLIAVMIVIILAV